MEQKEKSNKVRVNITISRELLDWYQDMADRSGMARSNCMVIGLMSYKDQQDMLKLTEIYRSEQLKMK